MTKRIFDRIESVKIEKLSKRYKNNYAIKGLDLEIKGGELLVLLGPSGCGKTTTLKTINRLVKPDEGKISINGKDVKDLDEISLRRNIGYVIQEVGLFPHMTVKENITLLADIEGWQKDKIDKRFKELMHLISLKHDEYEGRYPSQLSGGQKQRVGLARALMMDTPLLLMDEPFGALDPILRKQLQEEFLEIKKKLGKTIIFVTHDVEEAFRLGDRIAVMKEGKIVQAGEPNKIITDPEDDFVAGIVDSDRKFRHLDDLMVKDIMIPVKKSYFLDKEADAKDALKTMKKKNIEIGIVGKDRWVSFRELAGSGKKVKELAKKAVILDEKDNASEALRKMGKKKEKTIGIVMSDDNVAGMVFPDKTLFRLL